MRRLVAQNRVTPQEGAPRKKKPTRSARTTRNTQISLPLLAQVISGQSRVQDCFVTLFCALVCLLWGGKYRHQEHGELSRIKYQIAVNGVSTSSPAPMALVVRSPSCLSPISSTPTLGSLNPMNTSQSPRLGPSFPAVASSSAPAPQFAASSQTHARAPAPRELSINLAPTTASPKEDVASQEVFYRPKPYGDEEPDFSVSEAPTRYSSRLRISPAAMFKVCCSKSSKQPLFLTNFFFLTDHANRSSISFEIACLMRDGVLFLLFFFASPF
jgi:hypothetical protein